MKTTNRSANNVATKPAPVQTEYVPDLIDELDAAKSQSHALHMLMLDVLTTKDEGAYGEKIHHGIFELVSQTEQRLDRVAESVEKLARSQAG